MGFWLTTLLPDGPLAVVLETYEDIVLVYVDHLIFMQVKTRVPKRGVWTLAAIKADGGGLDSLVRTYSAVSSLEATFELLLEGPCTTAKPGADFFRDPQTASVELRARLASRLKTDANGVEAFLARLAIRPNQRPRHTVEEHLFYVLSLLFPTMSHQQTTDALQKLIAEAEGCQAGAALPRPGDWGDVCRCLRDDAALPGDVQARTLTKERLLQLLPSLPAALPVSALERVANSDIELTALERKLLMAGATPATVDAAKLLRSEAESQRLQLLAASYANAEDLDTLATRVIQYATSVAVTTPPHLPAGEHIFHTLRQQVHNLRLLDDGELFSAGPFGVLGFLCELSDECQFAWLRP